MNENEQKIIIEHRTGWYHISEGAGCFLMCIGLAVLIYVCFYVGAC
jgi:hypothetical protein